MFGDASFGSRAWSDLGDPITIISAGSAMEADFEFIIYVGTSEYVTSSTDTPPNTPFLGRLRVPSEFRRSILGSSIESFSTGDGQLIVDNRDALYDFLIEQYAVDGRDVEIRVGRKTDAYAQHYVLFKGTAADWNIDEASVQVLLRDNSFKLQVPAQSTLYAGTGGAEGGDDLAQKRKPRCFGYVRNVRPPLVVPSLLIYQVNDGEISDVPAVYDRGATLNFGTDRTNYADMAAHAPASGEFDTCLAEGLFRLGASPGGTVTADVDGDARSSEFVYTAGKIIRRLIALETEIVDPDEIYEPSFTAIDTAQGSEIGFWLGTDDALSVADVMAQIMGSVGGWAGFRRDGKLALEIFLAPGSTADQSFDETEIFEIKREPLPSTLTPPPWRFRVAYERAWHQQTDLAGTVPAAHRAFVADPYRLAEDSSASILSDHPLGQDPDPIEAYFRDEADAENEAQRLLALYGTTRSLYRLTLPRRALILDIGETIDVEFPRWDLSVGKKMRVVEITENLTAPSEGAIDTVEVVAYG